MAKFFSSWLEQLYEGRLVKIEKTIVFDENEQSELTNISNFCNEARNFFTEEGVHSVRVVTHGGHPVGEVHLRRAFNAVAEALATLRCREPHGALPVELKARYEANLLACLWKLGDFLQVVGVARSENPQGSLSENVGKVF